MGALASGVRIRHQVQSRLADARSRTDELFGIVREEAMYERPIPERHRIIFYLGHVEAFDWNLLAQTFGLESFHPTFDQLFAFGIDPVSGTLPNEQASAWPSREEIERYNRRIRQELDAAIERTLTPPSEGHPQLLEMLEAAVEHRLMHAETLAYMLNQLPAIKKVPGPKGSVWKTPPAKSHLVEIPAGVATLGCERGPGQEFAWDNEMSVHVVEVDEFAIDNYNVTNRDFMLFIQSGGYQDRSLWDHEAWAWKEKEGVGHPSFWRRAGSLWWYRTMFGDIQLPLDWPVYVSHAEATAYVNWLGRKLPTEAQFHRAAYATSDEGVERHYPWGDEPPNARLGNFDFSHWDPTPVGSYPRGASAFGVQDIVGNGWEWTRSKFEAFPGFMPQSYYPGYSANFFDGKHYVIKGGSPRTARGMLRRSFRNWFQPLYPYVYATFRCVED